MVRPIIYLATPYSHDDPAVREARYVAVTRYAARMIRQGHVVFSPISMSHPIEVIGGDEPAPSDVWVDFDEPFMEACAEAVVLMLPGWEQSRGVAREIAYFTARGKPVRFVEPCE